MRGPTITLEGVRLPIVEIKGPLFHRGWLDRRRRKFRATFEGDGVSVTTAPEAWDQIARGLLSGPLWELSRPGHAFVDMRAAEASGALARLGRRFGVPHGLLRTARMWEHRYYDGELEDTRFALFPDRPSAEAEREDCECGSVRAVTVLVPTAKLRRQFPRVDTNEHNALTRLLEYLLRKHQIADGLWWSDRLDPYAYSAPRGEILPHALSTWSRRKVEGDNPEPATTAGRLPSWWLSPDRRRLFFAPTETYQEITAEIRFVPGPGLRTDRETGTVVQPGEGRYIPGVWYVARDKQSSRVEHPGTFQPSAEASAVDLRRYLEQQGLPAIGASQLVPVYPPDPDDPRFAPGVIARQPGYAPDPRKALQQTKLVEDLRAAAKRYEQQRPVPHRFGTARPAPGQPITAEDVQSGRLQLMIDEHGDFDLIIRWGRGRRERIRASAFAKHYAAILQGAEAKRGDYMRDVTVATATTGARQPTSMRCFEYTTSCTAAEGPDIQDMVDHADDVSYATVVRHCADVADWALVHGYEQDSRRGLTLKNDWHVSYHRSVFRGRPCFFLDHSRIDHIWTLVDWGHCGPVEAWARRVNPFVEGARLIEQALDTAQPIRRTRVDAAELIARHPTLRPALATVCPNLYAPMRWELEGPDLVILTRQPNDQLQLWYDDGVIAWCHEHQKPVPVAIGISAS